MTESDFYFWFGEKAAKALVVAEEYELRLRNAPERSRDDPQDDE